jgi:hypothetical protein
VAWAASYAKATARSPAGSRYRVMHVRFGTSYLVPAGASEAIKVKEQELRDLFLDSLKDIYFTAKKIL